MLPKFASVNTASQLLLKQGSDCAIVKNADYIYPEFEIYPLAPKTRLPIDGLKAVMMDMDGTTTTTESLCIHSLEFMVRRMTGRMTREDWLGLNSAADYPHIIGNSTTKHVEYLIQTYQADFQPDRISRAYLEAVIWFLVYGKDNKRVQEVHSNIHNLGCSQLLKDLQLTQAINEKKIIPALLSELSNRYHNQLTILSFSDLVRCGIDIYYQRYHEILEQLESGKGKLLSKELLGDPEKGLIEPMPGVGIFLALIKGWLGDEAALCAENLRYGLIRSNDISASDISAESARKLLEELGLYFENNPVRVAVVTSSIEYEARIVLKEVFRVILNQIQHWPVSAERKKQLEDNFSDYKNVYNGFVTASDSNEIRLKPHRDLYSIALHQIGIAKEDFCRVIGFEDSESGTIAIRAAGIGICVAVPFAETQQHDFSAATHIIKGGLPEVLLKHKLFL